MFVLLFFVSLCLRVSVVNKPQRHRALFDPAQTSITTNGLA